LIESIDVAMCCTSHAKSSSGPCAAADKLAPQDAIDEDCKLNDAVVNQNNAITEELISNPRRHPAYHTLLPRYMWCNLTRIQAHAYQESKTPSLYSI
jgi:hypothetical protein